MAGFFTKKSPFSVVTYPWVNLFVTLAPLICQIEEGNERIWGTVEGLRERHKAPNGGPTGPFQESCSICLTLFGSSFAPAETLEFFGNDEEVSPLFRVLVWDDSRDF